MTPFTVSVIVSFFAEDVELPPPPQDARSRDAVNNITQDNLLNIFIPPRNKQVAGMSAQLCRRYKNRIHYTNFTMSGQLFIFAAN